MLKSVLKISRVDGTTLLEGSHLVHVLLPNLYPLGSIFQPNSLFDVMEGLAGTRPVEPTPRQRLERLNRFRTTEP